MPSDDEMWGLFVAWSSFLQQRQRSLNLHSLADERSENAFYWPVDSYTVPDASANENREDEIHGLLVAPLFQGMRQTSSAKMGSSTVWE